MWQKKISVLVSILFVISTTRIIEAGNLVTNGGFEVPNVAFPKTDYGKERFMDAKPSGWSGGDRLTYLCAPGTASTGEASSIFSVWTSPGDTSPAGGNFVMADGDPPFRDAIYQTLDHLVVGQIYQVSFYQASGQNKDQWVSPTWEQWEVSLGGTTQYSKVMETEAKGMTPWTYQTLFFKADSTSEKLSFLANGGPGGAPPVSFLDGVSVNAVPEPSSIALTAVGLLGFGVLSLLRRMKSHQNVA